MTHSNFIFVELAGSDAKAFDGLAAGTFTDMRGKRVTFEPEELSLYIANSQDILESTRAESGELVGLPIDMDGHDHKGGAGWITGFQLDPSRNVVRFLSNWTEEGAQLIRGNKRRYFSPTVDMSNKSILGGSLTNWPASRDERGRMMLRPIELSQQIQEIEPMDSMSVFFEKLNDLSEKVIDAIKGRKDEPEPEPQKEIENMGEQLTVAEFMQTPEAVAELERRATERAAELLKAEQLKSKVAEFAKRVTAEGTHGLAIKADELSAAILALPEAEKVLELVGKVADAKLVNFSEEGTGGHVEDPKGQEVPEGIKSYLKQWVEGGKSAEEFFAVNPELGAASDYNLSEFANKEK